jgi:hypothetical protein
MSTSPTIITEGKNMRSMGNALVWIGLTVGLPGVLYAMSIAPKVEEPSSQAHHPEKCAVCRHYRGLKVMPANLSVDDIVLVSPGHPIVVTDSAGDAE